MKKLVAIVLIFTLPVSGCSANENNIYTQTDMPASEPTETPAATAEHTAMPSETAESTATPTEVPTPTPTAEPTPTPITDLSIVLPDGNTLAVVLWYVSKDNSENDNLRRYGGWNSDYYEVISRVYITKSGILYDFTDKISSATESNLADELNSKREGSTDYKDSDKFAELYVNDTCEEFVYEAYFISKNISYDSETYKESNGYFAMDAFCPGWLVFTDLYYEELYSFKYIEDGTATLIIKYRISVPFDRIMEMFSKYETDSLVLRYISLLAVGQNPDRINFWEWYTYDTDEHAPTILFRKE